jgi:hypothetical protein
MCDLLVVFCDQLASNPQLAELVYEPDRGLQIQLNDFIQNYVFIVEEDGKLLLTILCVNCSVHIVLEVNVLKMCDCSSVHPCFTSKTKLQISMVFRTRGPPTLKIVG